ncbi:MAG: sensor histidine kinase [Gemmatimonadales bacterium]
MPVTALPAPMVRFPRWSAVAVWLGVATLSPLGRVVDARLRGLSVSPTELLWTFGVSWLILGAWSPLALRLARGPVTSAGVPRVRFDSAGLRRLLGATLVFHVGAQATTAVVEVLVIAPMLGWTEPSFLLVFAGFLSRRLVISLLVMGAIIGFDLVQQVVEAERERRGEAARLGVALRDARLAELRAELRPHFVFNTLNAISEAVSHDPRGADRMIAHLGELLQATYETPGAEHPLGEELALAQAYLAIQRMRYPDLLLEPELDVDPALHDLPVPTMVLQPLLENAIRHGILPGGEPGPIRLAARDEGGRVMLEVGSPGPPQASSGRTGVGLRNTRERLALLHGAEGRLEIGAASNGWTRVVLSWPHHLGVATAVGA